MAEGWSALGAFAGNALMSAFQNNMAQNNAMAGIGLSEAAQKRLMNHQAKVNWDYYIKDLQNKYVYGRQGLEAANYNPMLALGGISGNNSWTSPQGVSDLGLSENAIAGFSNATQQQLANQQGRLNEAQIQNLGTQDEVNNATAGLNRTQSRLNELKAIEQSVINSNLDDNIKADIRQKCAVALKNEVDASLAGYNATTGRIVANANAQSVHNQTKLLKYQIDNMVATKELTKAQAAQIKAVLPYLPAEEISKIFGNIVGSLAASLGAGSLAVGAFKKIGAPTSTGIIHPTKQVSITNSPNTVTKSGIIHKKYY